MHGIAICYVQHCQSMLERGVRVLYFIALLTLLRVLNTAHTVQRFTQSIITLVETQ